MSPAISITPRIILKSPRCWGGQSWRGGSVCRSSGGMPPRRRQRCRPRSICARHFRRSRIRERSAPARPTPRLMEYFEKHTSGAWVDASRLFLYKVERDLLGWKGDTGAFLRTAMDALVMFGAPAERYWPYDGRPPATNTRYD